MTSRKMKVLTPNYSLCSFRAFGMRGTFALEALASQCTVPLAHLNSLSLGNLLSLWDLPGHFSGQLRGCDAITFRVYSAHVPPPRWSDARSQSKPLGLPLWYL